MAQLKKIKVEKRFRYLFMVPEEEVKAIEALALTDGEVYSPLFVWKEQGTLIYGYHLLAILKKHSQIKYTVRELELEDWQAAQVWAIEHYIAQPEISLWQKLEASIKCESYWVQKERAKKSQGTRTDLSSPGEDKLESSIVDDIIARKVGCCSTYVYYFRKIQASCNSHIIRQCQQGEMSIKAAYEKVTAEKTTKKNKPKNNKTIKIEINGLDIIAESQKNIKLDGKNVSGATTTPVDPNPIAEKMVAAKVPDGSIWISVDKKAGQLREVKKSFDELKGVIQIDVNAFNFRVVSNDEQEIILEASPIVDGAAVIKRKDDSEFEKMSKKAS